MTEEIYGVFGDRNRVRIMFVCHGNICRSPMAEFIFKDVVAKRGAADRFSVASSATSTEEIVNGVGNPVYPPAKAELAKHGVRCEDRRAVQIKKSDYGRYDLFIGMDDANVRNMLCIFGGDPDGKVRKLQEYTAERLPIRGIPADSTSRTGISPRVARRCSAR